MKHVTLVIIGIILLSFGLLSCEKEPIGEADLPTYGWECECADEELHFFYNLNEEEIKEVEETYEFTCTRLRFCR